MIVHALKSARTQSCAQPALSKAASPRHTSWAPAAPTKDSPGCLASLEMEWITARTSKEEIWVLGSRLAKGFAYCIFTDAQSLCSLQLCHSSQCRISYCKGHVCTPSPWRYRSRLPTSYCQILLLWNCLLLYNNDPVGSHFSIRGTMGPLVYLISLHCTPVPSL